MKNIAGSTAKFREMTEGKEMTDRIRRILERERESLGITKERAMEIEQMSNF